MTTGLTATTNFIAQKIDKNMVDSVADAIFQRAASKSQQAVENSSAKSEYNTDNFKTTLRNEVMDEARKSIVKAANPFAEGLFAAQATSQPQATQAAAASSNVTETQASGLKAISNNAVRPNNRIRVQSSMALQNGMFTSAIRESMMIQAKEQITNNYDLMSRLQFLNSKTAVNTYPTKEFK